MYKKFKKDEQIVEEPEMETPEEEIVDDPQPSEEIAEVKPKNKSRKWFVIGGIAAAVAGITVGVVKHKLDSRYDPYDYDEDEDDEDDDSEEDGTDEESTED